MKTEIAIVTRSWGVAIILRKWPVTFPFLRREQNTENLHDLVTMAI